MALDVSVVIGTFGDPEWIERAQHARSTVPKGVPVIHCHEQTLAQARNAGLQQVQTEWVIHLDADDELTPDYIDTMAAGTADIRAPAISYIRHGINGQYRPLAPWMPQVYGHDHQCVPTCLSQGNYIAVGAYARTQLLREVGGWEEWAVYEDWAIWLRCWLSGATIESIPEAIYVAHVRAASRNRGPDVVDKNKVHYQIVEAIMPQAIA